MSNSSQLFMVSPSLSKASTPQAVLFSVRKVKCEMTICSVCYNYSWQTIGLSYKSWLPKKMGTKMFKKLFICCFCSQSGAFFLA